MTLQGNFRAEFFQTTYFFHGILTFFGIIMWWKESEMNYHFIRYLWNSLCVLYPLAKGLEIKKTQLISWIPYEMKIHFRSYITISIRDRIRNHYSKFPYQVFKYTQYHKERITYSIRCCRATYVYTSSIDQETNLGNFNYCISFRSSTITLNMKGGWNKSHILAT